MVLYSSVNTNVGYFTEANVLTVSVCIDKLMLNKITFANIDIYEKPCESSAWIEWKMADVIEAASQVL